MIGVCADLRRARISAAVSKPSMPGMLTSSRMTANSCSSSQRSASSPERGGDDVLAELLEDRPEDEELVGQVVHDQDVRPLAAPRRSPSRLGGDGAMRRCMFMRIVPSAMQPARSTASSCSVSTGLDR